MAKKETAFLVGYSTEVQGHIVGMTDLNKALSSGGKVKSVHPLNPGGAGGGGGSSTTAKVAAVAIVVVETDA